MNDPGTGGDPARPPADSGPGANEPGRLDGAGQPAAAVRLRPVPRPRFLLSGALFLATLVTTLWVGGAHGIASEAPGILREGGPTRSTLEWIVLWVRYGIPYAFSLLAVLLCHEMGHWFTARRYRVDASLPYFLPMPFTLVGTLGAFIRIRSPFPNRKALLDVGLAGPLAGFLVCLPLLAAGVAASRPGPAAGGSLEFGEPLLFQLFAHLFGPAVPDGQVLFLSPMGLAAWFGLLVTAINLLPMGQLDGGHALYAVLRGRARKVSRTVHLLMFPLALLSPSWLLWALLCLLLGARRAHPPTLDDEAPLPKSRRALAWAGLATFLLCFTPEPIVMDWSAILG